MARLDDIGNDYIGPVDWLTYARVPTTPPLLDEQWAAQAARLAAAQQQRRAVLPPTGRQEGLLANLGAALQSNYPIEPDLAGYQSGEVATNIPEGFVVDDAGRVVNPQTGEERAITRRP